MNKFFASLTLVIIIASCSNSPDMETGETRTMQILSKAFDKSNKPERFIDARNLINREQIDAANIPVLFVELASGKNGTLIPYPGQGIGQTWLGADGATVTLEKGILKASRGLGDDLMGSASSIPLWSKINEKTSKYTRELIHITGNNKNSKRVFRCGIKKISNEEVIDIWDVDFKVTTYEEDCQNNGVTFKNIYYLDMKGIVRRSLQYHGATIGHITIERLDL